MKEQPAAQKLGKKMALIKKIAQERATPRRLNREEPFVAVEISCNPQHYANDYDWEITSDEARVVGENLARALRLMYELYFADHRPGSASVTTVDGAFSVNVSMPDEHDHEDRDALVDGACAHIQDRIEHHKEELLDPRLDPARLRYTELN